MVGSQKLTVASLGVTPAIEWMVAASIVDSKARKAERLASSSDTRAR